LVAAAVVLANSLEAQAGSPEQSGTIVGLVTMKEGDLPLPYSVVSAGTLGREQFTNASGAFTMSGLPPGVLRLRVRHLGYTPANVDVVVREHNVDTVRIALSHIAVRLSALQVRAYPPCVAPGAPPSTDSSFAVVFDQLRQNAEQYRLLSRTYPFEYGVERTTSITFQNNVIRRQKVDTIGLRSVDEWHYQPGNVVTENRRFFWRDDAVTLRIPTLSNFADTIFIANHCFYSAGLESVDGRELYRIDFTAASRIREPDVEGSLYLDPTTFQIRRTFLRLSKTPSVIPDIIETEATTVFAELLPSVPIIAAISSMNRLKPVSNRANPPVATTEEQRLIAVQFTGRRPGDLPKTP
jgi:hypothetical protein